MMQRLVWGLTSRCRERIFALMTATVVPGFPAHRSLQPAHSEMGFGYGL